MGRAVVSLQAFPGGLPGFRCARAPGDDGSTGTGEADDGQEQLGLEMSWAQGRTTRALIYRRLP
jgi:hypothetical protein